MFCPLCKSMYRNGFNKCSDCRIALVGTYEEVKAAEVVLIWEGSSQSMFGQVVEALANADIPKLAKSGVIANPAPSIWNHVPIVSTFRRARRTRDNMPWRVFALQSDSARVKEVLLTLRKNQS
jgi:hypothetical protein